MHKHLFFRISKHSFTKNAIEYFDATVIFQSGHCEATLRFEEGTDVEISDNYNV